MLNVQRSLVDEKDGNDAGRFESAADRVQVASLTEEKLTETIVGPIAAARVEKRRRVTGDADDDTTMGATDKIDERLHDNFLRRPSAATHEQCADPGLTPTPWIVPDYESH